MGVINREAEMNHIDVIAHGAPNSFARKIQHDPGLAIEILRKCKWLLGHSVPSGMTDLGLLKYRKIMDEVYLEDLKEISDDVV